MPERNEAPSVVPTVITKVSGLIVMVGSPDISPAQASKLVRSIVKEKLPGKWKFKALDPSGRMIAIKPDSKTGEISIGKAWEHARKLESLSDIEFAEVDLVVPGHDPLPDQVLNQRGAARGFIGGKKHRGCSSSHIWSLEKLNVIKAWKLRPRRGGKRFGEGIEIGHPDTGYTEHPEIFNQRLLVAKGYDFEDDDPFPLDSLSGQSPGHGTSTASVIQSDHDSDIESTVSGTAPRATLAPFRVSDGVIHLKFSNVIHALYKSIDNGSHVVSMSLGGPFYSKALETAVNDAVRKGIIIVAAAGNHWPFVVYPAKLDQVIAVAATNCQDKPWRGSARGKSVDVAAPGESIWRAQTTETGNYNVERSHGTSYATAATAGIAALWLAHWGRDRLINQYGVANLASVFKNLLVTEGVRRPANWKSKKYGAGIIDALALLQAQLPGTAPARGFRFTARPAIVPGSDEYAEVLDYFPDIPRSRVAAVLAKTLKVDEDDLPEVLEIYGAELRFHLASNPEVRQRLQDQSMPQRRSLRGLSSTQVLSERQFKKQSSPGLRRLIGGA